ncbi:MAG: nucleotidyltransferase domain-containing protein [Candidatus Eisenbacteria bacterium]|uniref:Nucleotidyltransferase domain-containing protein n=1 Tax=Eiseniibacteriota bacterium TaxID=2212470 RepID=A0A956NI25_UNCEI|nr:nucleotidyltransferase domain-containing protein [Candidatus Eisenbacteria bacterium]
MTRGSQTQNTASPAYRVSRDQIIQALTRATEPLDYVLAGYLGGSDATGRTDEYSDVDYQVIVEDDRVEDVFEVVLRELAALSPASHQYRLPEPTWHGCSQVFLSLADADPAHFIDFVAMKRSHTDRFLEEERHGVAIVLFDKEGLVTVDPFDRETHLEKMRTRLSVLRETFPLFQTLVTRAVRRGFPAEAAAAYRSHTLHPLIELLRMKYCPDRYDFGPRYLDRDLPPEWRDAIDALALPTDLEEIETFRTKAEAHFAEVLRTLDA